jgi:hypothetical protein
LDDEVEVLAGVDVDLDVPLEDGRGVAPAGSVLASGTTARCVTAPIRRGPFVRPRRARGPWGRAGGHRAHPAQERVQQQASGGPSPVCCNAFLDACARCGKQVAGSDHRRRSWTLS